MLRIGSGRALIPALALIACAVGVPAAWATYPGRNGRIVILQTEGTRGMAYRYALMLIDPRSGTFRKRVDVCAVYEDSNRPACWIAAHTYLSRDGLTAGVLTYGFNETHPSALLKVSLSDGQVSSSPISSPGPWLGLTFDGQGTPALVPRPRSSDPRQNALLANAGSVDWSADGRVAFSSGGDVYAGPASGPYRRMTFRGGAEPSWSPHGRWIAFSRRQAVYVVPSAGGRAREVAPPSRSDPFLPRQIGPVWSPDGRKIAFYRQMQVRGQQEVELDLYTVDWKVRKLRRIVAGLMDSSAYNDYDVASPLWQALRR
jgi:WD40-like Beta Propeller Repeat